MQNERNGPNAQVCNERKNFCLQRLNAIAAEHVSVNVPKP